MVLARGRVAARQHHPAVRQMDKPAAPAERRALAHRYLGQELGDFYIQATEADAARNVVFRMSPECWLTTDFARQFGQLCRSQGPGGPSPRTRAA